MKRMRTSRTETCVVSSVWMAVISSRAMFAEEKPAVLKSDAWNFFTAWL